MIVRIPALLKLQDILLAAFGVVLTWLEHCEVVKISEVARVGTLAESTSESTSVFWDPPAVERRAYSKHPGAQGSSAQSAASAVSSASLCSAARTRSGGHGTMIEHETGVREPPKTVHNLPSRDSASHLVATSEKPRACSLTMRLMIAHQYIVSPLGGGAPTHICDQGSRPLRCESAMH